MDFGWRWKLLSVFGGAFFATSCISVRDRSAYDVTKFDDLVVTNSENAGKSPQRLGDHRLQIEYEMIIADTSSTRSYVVDAEQARFYLGPTDVSPFTVTCGDGQPAPLSPGAKLRLSCRVVVSANANNHLSSRDVNAQLKIPYSSGGSAVGAQIEGFYKLRAEDFE